MSIPVKGWFESKEAFVVRSARYCRRRAIEQSQYLQAKIRTEENNNAKMVNIIQMHVKNGAKDRAIAYLEAYQYSKARLARLMRHHKTVKQMGNTVEDRLFQGSLESTMSAFTMMGTAMDEGHDVDMDAVLAKFDSCVTSSTTSMSMVEESLDTPDAQFERTSLTESQADMLLREICPELDKHEPKHSHPIHIPSDTPDQMRMLACSTAINDKQSKEPIKDPPIDELHDRERTMRIFDQDLERRISNLKS